MSLHFIQRITFLAGILILDAAITCCHVKQPDDTRDPSRQASTDNPNLDNREIEIEYFGQSCFLLTTPANTRILTDPVEFKGYHLPTGTEAGIVTISHNHPDHNRADLVAGNPVILRGTSPDLQRVNQIDETIRDIRIYTVPSYHSPGKHGMNAIFVFEFDGVRLVHLGDLGTTLTDQQIEAIGPVDILMIPVGGQFTISGAVADSVVDQLAVKSLVFPMHYQTEAFPSLPYSADDYLFGKSNIQKVQGNTIRLRLQSLTESRKYIVLDYKES